MLSLQRRPRPVRMQVQDVTNHNCGKQGHIASTCRLNIQYVAAGQSTIQLAAATSTDVLLSKVYSYTQKAWPWVVDEELKPFATKKEELTVECGYQVCCGASGL